MSLQVGGGSHRCLRGCGILALPPLPTDDAQPGSSGGPAGKDKDKALPSFWIPSLTPETKATKLEKPVSPLPQRAPVRPLCQRGPGSPPHPPPKRGS